VRTIGFEYFNNLIPGLFRGTQQQHFPYSTGNRPFHQRQHIRLAITQAFDVLQNSGQELLLVAKQKIEPLFGVLGRQIQNGR
jgi:hypothetical protein